MTTRDELLATLAPILDVVRTLDLSKPDDALRVLEARFPLNHPTMQEARAQFRNGVVEGWLCDRESGGVKYSRVAKDAGGWSVDAVHMRGPAAGGHTHPEGEVDLCFAVDLPTPYSSEQADPRFDGRSAGWCVYPPGSWHVPTVTAGAMDIVYFLPKGAIQFGPKS